jgi:hypothetical protein
MQHTCAEIDYSSPHQVTILPMPNELIGLAIGLMFMEVLKFAYFFSAQLKHDILSTMLCWNLAIAVMIAMAMAWTPCRACPGGSRGSREPGAVSCDWPTRFTVTDIEARYGDYSIGGGIWLRVKN